VQLTGLAVHPLKSGAARPVASAGVVAHRGLLDDRTWMAVDPDGVMVSCREAPRLLHVLADTAATDASVGSGLRLRAPGLEDLMVEEPTEVPVPVRLFSLDLKAVPAGPEADAWLSAAVGHDVRLVWCDDPSRRTLQPGYSRPGDHATFPDSFPVTVASGASLRQVNDWMVEAALERGEEVPDPLPMTRYRPNLVVDGDEPFAEDGWSRVRVGEVTFRVGKPVARCFMTTIDPVTLARGHEPLRTLARHRRTEAGKTLFAVHLVPETSGTVTVGDAVSAS
jgi:uncharacterized protein YcbX